MAAFLIAVCFLHQPTNPALTDTHTHALSINPRERTKAVSICKVAIVVFFAERIKQPMCLRFRRRITAPTPPIQLEMFDETFSVALTAALRF